MNWSNLRTGLSSWVTSVTGIPAVWLHTSDFNKWTGKARVVLSISSPVSVGLRDEISYTEDTGLPDPGEELLVSVVGRRMYTVSFLVEIFDQRADYDALHYTEILRIAFWSEGFNSAIFPLGLAPCSVLMEQRLDADYERRVFSAAQLDVCCNAIASFTDAPNTYIEFVEAESDFLDPNGDPLPEQFVGTIDIVP